MPFSRRPNWDTSNLPNLRFRDGHAYVDIGYLADEEHRQAFAAIFAKVLVDNVDPLGRFAIASIAAKRPLPVRGLDTPGPGMALNASIEKAVAFALDLYDSHNDEVSLQLVGPSGRAELGIRFDNPAFWFRAAAV